MKRPVYVLGNGLVGRAIHQRLLDVPGIKVHSNTELPLQNQRIASAAPITDISNMLFLMRHKFGGPSIIINAMGVVGKPNVDWCEDNKEETKYVNVDVAEDLAWCAAKMDVPLIHISTGCIFNDPENTLVFRSVNSANFEGSFYSHTKAEAERRLRGIHEDYPNSRIELHRIRMPFFGWSDPRNLFDKIIKYDTLVNARNSMTCLEDYVDFVVRRVHQIQAEKIFDGYFRVFHAVNKNPVTHRDVLDIIREKTAIKTGTKKYITPRELDKITRAPRSNCMLGDAELPDTTESLRKTIDQYGGY
jgi:dTDP-4-dehydrorhamnose reductase